jgi:hypothetical protein
MNNDTDLRWRLRQLPHEIEPPRDLWQGIEARLDRPARRRPWLTGLALAASLTLAVALVWQLRAPPAPAPTVVATVATPEPAPTTAQPDLALVQREADAMTREYRAALREFAGAPMPEPLAPALATLDASAVEIRAAIDRDPEAVFLLDRLRSTYARRISLTQRAATG